ncbi:hypothetical protein [Pseudoxanthomonas sp. SE1]|uniref:hypothetical protein n=1 Tax=Pseudoxanthomonas sp. SE1 TaxID=1664560 RepID=UPI00240D4B11|nr:hypothetical protein [Pseudoxanthomonas sp. SE1]WFC40864.1 hypothetical protein OY559_13745 [Pseudoxanthomonas sp. SE1]
MNTMLRLAVVLSVCALLAACASTRGTASSSPPVQRQLTAEQQYIAYVERIAKRRGIHLTWVNPPRIEDRTTDKQ